MRQWIDLITESQDFRQFPFVHDFETFVLGHGGWTDKDPYGTYCFSTNDWHVYLRPYGTWSGQEYENTVEIQSIQVSEAARQRGLGAMVMNKLCALADQYHVPLILIADETNDVVGDDPEEGDEKFWDYDEREHWLQTWYSRLGFDYTGDVGDYGPYMERAPR